MGEKDSEKANGIMKFLKVSEEGVTKGTKGEAQTESNLLPAFHLVPGPLILRHQNAGSPFHRMWQASNCSSSHGPGQAKASLHKVGESPACSYTGLSQALVPSCTLKRSKIDVSHEGKAFKGQTSCQLSEVVLCLNLGPGSRSRHLSWLLQGNLSCYFWVGHWGGGRR